MKRFTSLFLFLFIPSLFIIGCNESGNITETGQSQIDLTPVDPTKIVDIPDENLAKLIRETLELPDDVDEITAGQLATLAELINLETLYLQDNPIADKTPLDELRKNNPNVVIHID